MGRPALDQSHTARSERFWKKVIFTLYGCWLWNGGINSKGYGNFGPQLGVNIRAHRFAFEDFYGVNLSNELKVLHSCDVRNCVNPSHLWIGTDKDNCDDKCAKGRWNGGAPRTAWRVLIILFLFVIACSGATVVGKLISNGRVLPNVSVTFAPYNALLVAGQTNVITAKSTIFTDSGGNFSALLDGGIYNVVFGSGGQTNILVPAFNTNTFNLSDLVFNPSLVTINQGNTTIVITNVLIVQGTNTVLYYSNGFLVVSAQLLASNVVSGGTVSSTVMPAFSGDITTSAGNTIATLATVNASPGTYGDGTHVSQVTVNGKGLVTTVSPVLISGAPPTGTAGGDLTGSYPNPNLKNTGTSGTYTKTTFDAQGREISGTTLSISDIPITGPPTSIALFNALNQLASSNLVFFTYSNLYFSRTATNSILWAQGDLGNNTNFNRSGWWIMSVPGQTDGSLIISEDTDINNLNSTNLYATPTNVNYLFSDYIQAGGHLPGYYPAGTGIVVNLQDSFVAQSAGLRNITNLLHSVVIGGYNNLQNAQNISSSVIIGDGISPNLISSAFDFLIGVGIVTPTNSAQNFAMGRQATVGATNSISMGFQAGLLQHLTATNNIYLGNRGTGNDTNVMRLGNVQSDSYLPGLLHIGNAASPVMIFSGNDGALWNSNKVLYWVTSTQTNLVSDGR